MKINKILLNFIFLLMTIFIIPTIKAENISCQYTMNKEKGADCYPSRDITSDSTFTVTIYMDENKKETDRDFPTFILNGKTGKYTNNVTSLTKETAMHPPLKYVDKFVSAKDYYTKTESCPPFFSVFQTYDQYYGTFASEKKETSDYLDCTFPLAEIEYNEEFEKVDEIYSCTLYSTDVLLKDIKLDLQINYTDKSISFGNITPDDRDGAKEALNNYKKNFDFSVKNKCPINELKICELPGYTFVYTKDFPNHPSGTCAILDVTEELMVGDTYCKFIVDMIKEMKISKEGYYNKLSTIKNFCASILETSNYDNIKYSCMDVCLNIQQYLPGLEFTSSTCGLSGRLILFIANIVRWIKYIIPVAVIILGILDFIKAIGADKEDEMKKAQGRFAKRLIVAALIFIIPLILEYILNKMGFDANGCGIIDL